MLNWGLGFEKEFPILIGKYYLYDLDKTLNSCIDYFRLLFIGKKINCSGLNKLLSNIYKTLIDNYKVTIELLDEDQNFYLNLENLINDYGPEIIDYRLFLLEKKNFRFIKSEEDFEFFYTNIYKFHLGEFRYSNTFLGKYIKNEILEYLLEVFKNYYISGILYLNDHCSYILDELNYIYHTLPIKNIFNEGYYQIEIREFNGIEIKKYKISLLNLEPDSGGYELRTDHFKNVSVVDCVKELENKITFTRQYLKKKILCNDPEKKLITCTDYASYYLPVLDKIGLVNYTISLKQIYSGETEINLTLPYLSWENINLNNNKLIENLYYDTSVISDRNTYETRFKRQHIELMKSLRLLSPLFMAVLTGVQYFSFGDNGKVPETSLRYKELGYRIHTSLNLDQIYNIDDTDSYLNTHNKCILDIFKKRGIPIEDELGIQEFSVNRKEKKYNPKKNKYFGFEWKVLDQYPTQYIINIVLFVILLAQWLHDKKLKIEDKLDCIKYEKFLETIIFQGWNTTLDPSYFKEICSKLKLENLEYETLNKYKIVEACTKNKVLDRNLMINKIKLKNYSSLSLKKLRKMSNNQLLEILCLNYKKSPPTCYSFLQGIFHYLYQNYINHKYLDDKIIIKSFFPYFEDNKYHQYNFIPNINLLNYNKMLDDYKKFHYQDYLKNYKKIITNPEDEDYLDLYTYLQKN